MIRSCINLKAYFNETPARASERQRQKWVPCRLEKYMYMEDVFALMVLSLTPNPLLTILHIFSLFSSLSSCSWIHVFLCYSFLKFSVFSFFFFTSGALRGHNLSDGFKSTATESTLILNPYWNHMCPREGGGSML